MTDCVPQGNSLMQPRMTLLPLSVSVSGLLFATRRGGLCPRITSCFDIFLDVIETYLHSFSSLFVNVVRKQLKIIYKIAYPK